MTAPWLDKRPLFIYRDGRVSFHESIPPDNGPGTVVISELWPQYACPHWASDPPTYINALKREFRYKGNVGPYSLWEEM